MAEQEALWTQGTYRVTDPNTTLTWIHPLLPKCGITRCADVTRLDELGIPTYCAIRPQGLTLQTSQGKGIDHPSAMVSALMEAIELDHMEHPPAHKLYRSNFRDLSRKNRQVVPPPQLRRSPDTFFSDERIIDWVEGEDLVSGKCAMLPASAVYLCEPMLCRTSTNGLASGNTHVEAMLHGIYELIERDALSHLNAGGRLQIQAGCQVVDLPTVETPYLQSLIENITVAGTKLVLLWVRSVVPIHTFWAVLLNKAAFCPITSITMGYGTHIDINVAASRAITEAAQSRLTFIHGVREDLTERAIFYASSVTKHPVYHFFDNLLGEVSWKELQARVPYCSTNLLEVYQYLVSGLKATGHRLIIRVDMTREDINIPVVKVLIPSLCFHYSMF